MSNSIEGRQNGSQYTTKSTNVYPNASTNVNSDQKIEEENKPINTQTPSIFPDGAAFQAQAQPEAVNCQEDAIAVFRFQSFWASGLKARF